MAHLQASLKNVSERKPNFKEKVVMESRRIQRLEEAVINRIAAGEVIQRPANATKEIIENSLDAGSTLIQVTVKSGGLKMLQIQDNGCGIEKEDLNIICERFTTSKLKKFEDLSKLNTYGFRGEALASISHVAHVVITSRTTTSTCAYKAAYSDGAVVALRPGGTAEPKLCAGNVGTLITVEDLFYNVSTRRKALKSPSDELAKITDIMTKYAVHNSGTGFTLRKHGATVTEIKTLPENSIRDNIGLLYGASVQKELVSVEAENKHIGFRMSGYVTNANFSMKKCQFLLFINNRLVDNLSLRKALELIYAALLPKNSHPFIYLSIFISPENIDVNVHPTKHEVHFLHEESIVDSIQKAIEKSVLSCSSSRAYYTQSLLPSTSTQDSIVKDTKSLHNKKTDMKVYDYKLVRTDAKEKKLEAFVTPKSLNDGKDVTQRLRKPIHLTSVLSLQNEIKNSKHEDLTNLFNNQTFVGFVDQTRILIQYQTGLYLMNMSLISKELFFQRVIFDFGNFGSLRLSPPAPICELVLLALESPSSGWSPEDGPKENLAQYVVELLDTKSKMLQEYFALEIKDNCVCTIPNLLDNYVPNLDRLPQFLLCLAAEVDWSTEKNCFLTFAQECGSFYSIQHDPFVLDSTVSPLTVTDTTDDAALYKDSSWQWIIKHVLLPSLGPKLIPPCSLAQNGSILQIADLHELYKVFERC